MKSFMKSGDLLFSILVRVNLETRWIQSRVQSPSRMTKIGERVLRMEAQICGACSRVDSRSGELDAK